MQNDFKLEATAQARVDALDTRQAGGGYPPGYDEEQNKLRAEWLADGGQEKAEAQDKTAREVFRQELLAQARQLVQDAEAHGFVVTIERRSVEPLAMRNTVAAIEVREAR